jgi:hypothetical protein
MGVLSVVADKQDDGRSDVRPNTPLREPTFQAAGDWLLAMAQCPISEPSRRINSRARTLSGRTRVVVKKSAKTLPPANPANTLPRWCAIDELVIKALVVAFAVVVLDELRDRSVEMTSAERDDTVEALVLDRAYKALCVGIRVGRLKRRLHHADPGFAQPFANGRTPFRVAVTDQHAMADQNTLIREDERTADLPHKHLVGMRRGTNNVDATGGQVDDKHGVVRHQPPPGPDFSGEEICARDRTPVRPQKRAP